VQTSSSVPLGTSSFTATGCSSRISRQKVLGTLTFLVGTSREVRHTHEIVAKLSRADTRLSWKAQSKGPVCIDTIYKKTNLSKEIRPRSAMFPILLHFFVQSKAYGML
jgi:hypothetical protein